MDYHRNQWIVVSGVQTLSETAETVILKYSGDRERLAIVIPKSLSGDSTFKLKTGDRVTLTITKKGLCIDKI